MQSSVTGRMSAGLRGGPCKSHSFIMEAIAENIQSYGASITAVKLLLPTANGYVVRNDIITRRLLTCQLAAKTADFTTLSEPITAVNLAHKEHADILEIAMRNAVGAVLLKTLPTTDPSLVTYTLACLEADLSARLSFPFILHQPLSRRRLAMVFGRPDPATSTASQGIYRASRALGIELVILDEEGHWAQASGEREGRLRQEFITCDLTMDDGLPARIVAALGRSRGGPVDGIVTFTDTHILATAQAAAMMGLGAGPADALECCRDKAKMRGAASTDVAVLSTTGLADLIGKLAAVEGSLIEYPAIVKPSIGCSSDGVSKVYNQEELLQVVRRNELKFPGVNLQIEPYISGPEVDANLVLLDGKLIWSEINDDYPSSADLLDTKELPHDGTIQASASFAEVSTIMPSILPQSEIELLTSSLTNTLLKLGFRNGIFHLEARINNSAKLYSMTSTGVKLLDRNITAHEVEERELEGREVPAREDSSKGPAAKDPSVFLIEINARLPGHQEDFAVEYTYGIDYFAIAMLMALLPAPGAAAAPAHAALIRALSIPFAARARYPSNIVFVSAEKGGLFRLREHLRAQSPPLPAAIASGFVREHSLFVKEGELVPDPETEGRWPFLAFFLVVATMTGAEGREQVRTVGELVRQSFEYDLD